MYKLEKIKDKQNNLEYLYIRNSNAGNTVKIYPKLGGTLQHLTLNNKLIIKKSNLNNYNQSFFSSILFPYANRVKKGSFSFKDTTYNLPLNEANGKNAIHGLIYNKEFEIKEYSLLNDRAIIKLSYTEKEASKTLPFNYTVELIYKIKKTSLSLQVNIKNKGTNVFPFSLGWHPYFYDKNRENSSIKLASNQQVLFSKTMVPSSFETVTIDELMINRSYDDCYKLTDSNVYYTNSDYNLLLTSSTPVNYLQIFTPKNDPNIAIEFMTSPPDSFNNKIDLLELSPQETFDVKWAIHLKK